MLSLWRTKRPLPERNMPDCSSILSRKAVRGQLSGDTYEDFLLVIKLKCSKHSSQACLGHMANRDTPGHHAVLLSVSVSMPLMISTYNEYLWHRPLHHLLPHANMPSLGDSRRMDGQKMSEEEQRCETWVGRKWTLSHEINQLISSTIKGNGSSASIESHSLLSEIFPEVLQTCLTFALNS